MGTSLIILFCASPSAAFFSSNVLREVVSKYVLSLSIKAAFSEVAAVIKSAWFKVTSDWGSHMGHWRRW